MFSRFLKFGMRNVRTKGYVTFGKNKSLLFPLFGTFSSVAASIHIRSFCFCTQSNDGKCGECTKYVHDERKKYDFCIMCRWCLGCYKCGAKKDSCDKCGMKMEVRIEGCPGYEFERGRCVCLKCGDLMWSEIIIEDNNDKWAKFR